MLKKNKGRTLKDSCSGVTDSSFFRHGLADTTSRPLSFDGGVGGWRREEARDGDG